MQYFISNTRNICFLQISESLNVFGIAENSRNLIVAVFDDKSGKKMVKVAKKIDGIPAPLHTLRELADIGLIKKVIYFFMKIDINIKISNKYNTW